jgi:16S rRNA (adenine1518-N6/adenine1519-N6)-dimethyltransferase
MGIDLKLLKKYNIKAKKSLWQNFLVNNEIIKDIADIIEIKWKDIIEIWPWYWALTQELLKKKPKSLTLLELDNDMINVLNLRLKDWEFDVKWVDFKIENIDVLEYNNGWKLKAKSWKETEYFVIANIPYYITSPILRHFLYGVENKPKKMLILMQKDVGDRIVNWKLKAKSWKENYKKFSKSSVLSLFVQKKCFVEEVLFVWKENFVPAPKVESSMLLFELHDLYNDIDDDFFLDFIKKWFREPRKKLLKNLVNAWYEKEKVLKVFEDLWIDENIRGEDLDVWEWSGLIKIINYKL